MTAICPLSPARLDDYLAFFDSEAFSDNPNWAGCYCYFYLAPHAEKEWVERTAAENRIAISQCIRDGQLHGCQAYVDGKMVGWCHAAPLSQLPNLYDPADPLAGSTGVILCFVIAPAYRRQGIAAQLLDAALDGFRALGLEYAEARPHPYSTDTAANYHGPLSMYLAAGFEIAGKSDHLTVVRKRLTPLPG